MPVGRSKSVSVWGVKTSRSAPPSWRCAHLWGDAPLALELQDTLRTSLFQSTVSEFIEAKLEERDSRHRKQGGQRYLLEPNVKEGKGGLRDLQTLYWIAKYEHAVDSAGDLVRLGLFRPEEFAAFDEAERFLWAVRTHLHLISNRALDQLSFDMQVQVAERMGYSDHSGRRAVEHFMQDYFRHATVVGDLTRIFLTDLEARHVKKEPANPEFPARAQPAQAAQGRLRGDPQPPDVGRPRRLLRRQAEHFAAYSKKGCAQAT